MAAIDPESELLFGSRWLHALWKTPLKMFGLATEDTDPDPEQVSSANDPSCSYIAQIACDRSLAQRLAATEQRLRLDFEFARKLQEQGGIATDATDADR